ncbi:Right handed beta helix region [Gracilibacillus orientalis]|uniref:Right handed beta helix region n=1 Tax=Gracilibacillus orientalis TaxID=334253 RepID=A0A1I4N8V7_9BACI|nr:cadherin-like beta sandwich domain-containing protein [Gracilibacillus orientalis]SFM11673.1 Right handed beta helix region [Gracilibacillus orientalis]
MKKYKSVEKRNSRVALFLIFLLVLQTFSAVFVTTEVSANSDSATESTGESNYLVDEDFESDFDPAEWDISESGGSVEVVESPRGDHALRMIREANSGETSFSKKFAAGEELTGIVTVEADIMRNDGVISDPSWASVPYIFGSNGNRAISAAFDDGVIKTRDGNTTVDVMEYEKDQWYNLKFVLDIDSQTYDLYVDGTLVADDYAFRESVSDIAEVKFYANSSNVMETYLDNVRIAQENANVVDDNATLASLSSDAGTFNVDDTNYSTSVPFDTSSINVTPTTESSNASIDIQGDEVVSGAAYELSLIEGENKFTLEVTAEDGTKVAYQINVTREAAPAVDGNVYYVDATNGNDDNDGTTEDAAWKSLDKVNATTFEPGDKILLKAGQSWTGQLYPKGSGDSDKPIVIDQYGSGDKPKIEGKGQFGAAVYLKNQSYWGINNLDVSNEPPVETTFAESLGNYRGIHITGDNGTQLNHFRINDVSVHDVSGEVNWIGGSPENPPRPGIEKGTGWDNSKRTGGIVFDTTVEDPANPGNPTTFNDVIVENSSIKNTSFGGIIIKQYAGVNEGAEKVGWGIYDSPSDETFTPHTNVTIRNNYLDQYDTDYGCNSIYFTSVQDGLIENNVVAGAGTSGIELYYTDDVVVQYNEVFDTRRKAGGADHNGIDADKATTNTVFQYNYVHDTGDGFLLCQFDFGDVIVRYNVVENTDRYPVYLHSNSAATAEIYNNTIYNEESKYMVYGYGIFMNSEYNIYNNILYSTRDDAVFTTGGGASYNNNSYYGADFPIPADDENAITIDPMLAAVNTGGKGTEESGPALDSLDGYKLLSGSPLIGAGAEVANNGGQDMAGNSVYHGTPDVGAFEYYGSENSTTESVTGKVKDTNGNRVIGAEVSVEINGQTYSDKSDKTGYFSLLNVPVGTDYTLTASKDGYNSGTDVVDVESTNTLSNVELVMEPTTEFGGISGIARDGHGEPLPGATITLTAKDETEYTTVSNESGEYVIDSALHGAGYNLKATKEGYNPDHISDIEIFPAHVAPQEDLFLTGNHPEYLINEDFESGQLPVDWDVSKDGGDVTVVTDPTDSTNTAFYFKRDTNSGVTSFTKNYEPEELTGIVTVEADIMRNDIYGSPSWVSIPYIYGSNGQKGVSFAFDKGNIVAYNGGASETVMPYEQGKWYNVQIVMNIITKEFDLIIDGQMIWDNAPFRSQIEDVEKIEVSATSSNMVEAYMDNIRVIKGVPYAKDDSTLDSIAISQGELTKVSDTRYTVDAGNYVDEIQVTPTTTSQFVSSVEVNGEEVENGQESQAISLNEGENEITITVTAEDGVTTETYTIDVTRTPAQKDTSLTDINLSIGELNPSFTPENTDYTVKGVTTADGEIEIAATLNTDAAGLTINGQEVESGEFSNRIPLTSESSITIRVDAQDGTAYREYTLTVIPEEPPAPELYHLSGDIALNGNVADETTVEIANSEGAIYTAAYNELTDNYGLKDKTDTSGELQYYFHVPEGSYSITVLQGDHSETVIVDTDADSEIVDGMYQQMVEQLSLPVDTEPLEAIIEEAQAIDNDNYFYTTESFEELQLAIESAEEAVETVETFFGPRR